MPAGGNRHITSYCMPGIVRNFSRRAKFFLDRKARGAKSTYIIHTSKADEYVIDEADATPACISITSAANNLGLHITSITSSSP